MSLSFYSVSFFLNRTFCASLFLFFFNDPATTEIYTLSLHDALPIWPPLPASCSPPRRWSPKSRRRRPNWPAAARQAWEGWAEWAAWVEWTTAVATISITEPIPTTCSTRGARQRGPLAFQGLNSRLI